MTATAQHTFDVAMFRDAAHHWYDIEDEEKVIRPLPHQPRCSSDDVVAIAENILLYQKRNGGWPKNYDMLALLSVEQRAAILASKEDSNTTFDNGTTHSQVRCLAYAFSRTQDARYRDAALHGIEYILGAQYPNGGWPQFWPDTSGYRKHITFNDGAMTGVMILLHAVVNRSDGFTFIDSSVHVRVSQAFERGVRCILNCQYLQNGVKSGWGQQHDYLTLKPQSARNFEPASLAGRETAELLRLLMEIDHPSPDVVAAVNAAVRWIVRAEIHGIRVDEFKAPVAHYQYRRNVETDRRVVTDSSAPVIWARMYELESNVPLFCNRDKKPVYSLAEVERERRTGYTWYSYEPGEVLRVYPEWQRKWSPHENALEH
jgi:PelA/Pel-15E family pectate lyase